MAYSESENLLKYENMKSQDLHLMHKMSDQTREFSQFLQSDFDSKSQQHNNLNEFESANKNTFSYERKSSQNQGRYGGCDQRYHVMND